MKLNQRQMWCKCILKCVDYWFHFAIKRILPLKKEFTMRIQYLIHLVVMNTECDEDSKLRLRDKRTKWDEESLFFERINFNLKTVKDENL